MNTNLSNPYYRILSQCADDIRALIWASLESHCGNVKLIFTISGIDKTALIHASFFDH